MILHDDFVSLLVTSYAINAAFSEILILERFSVEEAILRNHLNISMARPDRSCMCSVVSETQPDTGGTLL